MDERDELKMLRRLAELEAKAAGPGKAARDENKAFEDQIRADVTGDMSGFGRFVAGYGSAIPRIVRGVRQAVGLVSQEDVDEANRLDAPLLKTGAGSVGNIAGNVAAMVPTVAIPGAASLRGAALIGGATGALQPVGTGESRIANTALGVAAGAGGVMVGRGLSATYQGAKALAEPFTAAGRDKIAGRMLQRFADDASKIAGTTNTPTITGALPTLAEQTGDAGLSRLQDALRAVDPQINNQILGRLSDNNAARVEALRVLAGDSGTRTAAEAARKAATSDLYQQATKAAYTVDDSLQTLLSRPAVKQAMARAKTLAENSGRTVSFDVTAPNAFGGLGVPTKTTRQINGQALQDLKMAMDEMLTDPASGFTGKAGDTIKSLRGDLLSWMENANPAFKQARQTYAATSKPLNAMDVGEEIYKRATSNTSDLAGNPRMQANALMGLLRDEARLVERGAGRKGLGELADVFEPDQLAVLRGVASETDRAAAVGTAGNGPGSATAQRMASQNILRQLLGPTGLPESWAESAIANTVIGKPFNLIYGGVAEPKIQQALAQAVLDPKKAQEVLKMAQGLPPAQRSQLVQLLQALGEQAAKSTPAAVAVAGQR